MDSDGRCPIERIRLEQQDLPDGDRTWITLTTADAERALFSVRMRVASLGVLTDRAGESLAEIDRYVFQAAGRPPLEFQDGAGRALLPRFSFAKLLPRVTDDAGFDSPLAEEGHYLGYPVHRDEGAFPPWPVRNDEPVVLRIATDVLVGTSVARRDDGAPRARGLTGDYLYADLTERDYRELLDAGFNLFRTPRAHVEYVLEEPAFFTLTEGLGDFPGLLYRSNFFGCVLYMDEPVARALNRDMFTRFESPEQVARVIQEITRGRWEADYGRRLLPRLLDYAGFGVDRCDITQDDYPVWEAVESAAWYELEAGVPGWCYEARLDPAVWSRLVKARLGVEFPDEADSCLRYHFGMIRGAARHFGAEWGVGIYGQMDRATADRVFPLAYDLGATYFWLWTSDRDHHVPYRRQLELARALQQHASELPRAPDARSVAAGARTAVALPWGYACDQFALGVYGRDAGLWGSRQLRLKDRNPEGVPYGDVLKAALARCARLLDAGEPFDVVFWRAGQRGPGYARVYRILATGEERVE